MEPTDIASHVEQCDHTDYDNCLRGMGLSEQIIAGANWVVAFTTADGISSTAYRTGFKTKDEAEAFKKGWNEHRKTVSSALFIDVMIKVVKAKKSKVNQI